MRKLAIFTLFATVLSAQQPAPQQELEPMAVFKVDVVAKTAKAINYRHRSGATKIDFKGTSLLPRASGQAKVESKQGYIEVEVEFRNLEHATKFGSEYLTYVLWAITPEGRSKNLGEVLLNGSKSKLNVTTDMQVFGMVVTAEPYFSVTMPSDLVVLENMVRGDTKGKIEEIDAKYELLQRGQYEKLANPLALTLDPKVPLEIFEARNAIQIAKSVGAPKYSADTFGKAQKSLEQAEGYLARKSTKPAVMLAREAVQTAEDARAIAVRRVEEERIAREQREAAEREAAANRAAEEAARRSADAEAAKKAEEERRLRAEAARESAERQRLEAELAAARSATQRAEAEAAQARALAQEQAARVDADKARRAAEEAERLRQEAEREKSELRARLFQQFSTILETRDTDRGLVVNMGDVLFDTGKYTLRPLAREKLARLAGIVLAYPQLMLETEGHTDSVGGEEYNLKLSQQRAESVRDYLLSQGLAESQVSAKGMGEDLPIASNDTAQGRQQNRRVEVIVSGEVIGTKIGARSNGTP